MKRTISGFFCAALLAGSAATAQTPSPAAPAVPAAPVEAGDAVKADGSRPAATGVAVPSAGHNYSAEGRRDPFAPLLLNGAKEALATTAAARAAGLAGLGTSEVTLRGVLASQGGYVGMLLGSDEKTYIVRAGDKLADGTIRAITSQMMVINQQVKDPLSKQTEREVRKMLRQTDGTN